MRTASKLGDPLEFSLALMTQQGDALAADCIRADVFAGESRIADDQVRLSLIRAANGTVNALRVVTNTRIDEPLARIELNFECGISFRRSYVVFIDPPVIDLARSGTIADSAAAAPPSVPDLRRAAPAAPTRRTASRRSASAGSAAAAPRSGTRASTGRGQPPRGSAARVARPEGGTRDPVVAAAPREPGSSLRLESAPALRAVPPAGTGAAPAAAPGPATPGGTGGAASEPAVAAGPAASAAVSGLLGELAAKAQADAASVDAERLRTLDADLARLREDNAALQRSAAELRERLRVAEDDRSSSTLVYGLIAALLLLLLAVVALLVRQAALRREADWRRQEVDEPAPAEPLSSSGQVRSIVHPSASASSRAGAEAAAAAAARLAGAATTPGPRQLLTPAPAKAGSGVEAAAAASVLGTAAVAGAAPVPVAPGPHERTAIQEPAHEVSVDELIDLEQQADFFEVLGQDDAAIDLLMGQLQGAGGASPLPYLKLLEIHRRRGERAAYDRIRERFNHRFAAMAPDWESHSGHDRRLEDYPQVIERLQRNWASPAQSMNMLTDLLFGRHDSGESFDLPAYAELLFLYSVARDLAESEAVSDGIDLLLPLDVEPVSADRRATDFGALGDTRPGSERNDLPDLPFDVTGSGFGDRPARRSGREGSASDSDLNLQDPTEPKGPLSRP